MQNESIFQIAPSLACVAQQQCLHIQESVGPAPDRQLIEILMNACEASKQLLELGIIIGASIEVCSIIAMNGVPVNH